jgi:hypothetical protein
LTFYIKWENKQRAIGKRDHLLDLPEDEVSWACLRFEVPKLTLELRSKFLVGAILVRLYVCSLTSCSARYDSLPSDVLSKHGLARAHGDGCRVQVREALVGKVRGYRCICVTECMAID